VLDLRLICTHTDDYAAISPIEPSVIGGKKIADSIVRSLTSAPETFPGIRIFV
jgi:hypothetical protein